MGEELDEKTHCIINRVIGQISGLNPRGILCIDSGYVREEWKSLCFKMKRGITQYSIQNPQQIAQILVPESEGRFLSPFTRIELLRQCVKNPELRAALPTILQRQFRPRFFDALDRALQGGRLLFAHDGEAEVFEARLLERFGHDPRREEFFLLNRYWSRLLEVRNLWDQGRLFEVATQSERLSKTWIAPLTIFKLDHFSEQPRINHFWNELGKAISVERIHSTVLTDSLTDASCPNFQVRLQIKNAHSLEDAALFLLDEIFEKCKTAEDFRHHAIVIPDVPAIRRSVKRLAAQKGLPLQDERDPTDVNQSESFKLAILELELVGRRFPVSLVLSWLSAQPKWAQNLSDYRKKIIESGAIMGLSDYRVVPEVHDALLQLQQFYPSRLSFEQLQEGFFKSLCSYLDQSLLLPEIQKHFEVLFAEWELGLHQLNLTETKRPPRYWLEQLKNQLKKSSPPVPSYKHRFGIQLYRADQAPSAFLLVAARRPGENPAKKTESLVVHFLGIDSEFFESRETGTEWFSMREQEALAFEFGLSSVEMAQKQAWNSFLNWAKLASDSVYFWDYEFSETGVEREKVNLWAFANTEKQKVMILEEQEIGMHPSLVSSMFGRYQKSTNRVQLTIAQKEWPFSFLNAYGNCAFQSFASHSLKLRDERQTDFSLSGDVYGNLLHHALEILVREGTTPQEAFQRAWRKTKRPGWMRSERLFRSIEQKTQKILTEFLQSEEVYRGHSEAEPVFFEREIEWRYRDFIFRGRIDRVDQHRDGFIVIDYKTSAGLPSGKSMIEKGLELQLPLYALALQDETQKPVIAAQYLEMKKAKPNRNLGILFSQWNRSKKSDPVEFPISLARSRNSSLFEESPNEIWLRFQKKIGSLIEKLESGDFSPEPADAKVCDRCNFFIVCGKLRTSGGMPQEE